MLALAGGVDQHSDKGKVLECARLVLDMEGEKVDCVQRQGITCLMLAGRGGCAGGMAGGAGGSLGQ